MREWKNEDTDSPKKSDPYEWIFFLYFLIECEIENVSQESEYEWKKEKDEEKRRQIESYGDECRQEHLESEKSDESQVSDEERFGEKYIENKQNTIRFDAQNLFW